MSIPITFTTRLDGDFRKRKIPLTIFAQQIHGNTVARVSKDDVGTIIRGADGLVYKKEMRAPIFLAVRVADCIPIIAYDSAAQIIGAAHAGWRGTFDTIAQELIIQMCKLGGKIRRIHVSMGPHIGACCYGVDKERAAAFQKKFGTKGHYLDLGAINRDILVRMGVISSHILVSDICTSCHNDQYFSYRKDTKETFGEQVGMIGI